MGGQRVVVVLGSRSDLPFAERIRDFLGSFGVDCEFRVCSAHRSPRMLLEFLESYEGSGDQIVYITVAGLSDALSGVVAGSTGFPVIACPPDVERFGWSKVFSSLMTPRGVAVLVASNPENAALAAVKILALSNGALREAVRRYRSEVEEEVRRTDEEVRRTEK